MCENCHHIISTYNCPVCHEAAIYADPQASRSSTTAVGFTSKHIKYVINTIDYLVNDCEGINLESSTAETKLTPAIKPALCMNTSHPRILLRISKPLEQRPTDPQNSQPVRATSNTCVPALGPVDVSAPGPRRAQFQAWL